MIKAEIKKINVFQDGNKSAQIEFTLASVGPLKGKKFNAWGVIEKDTKVGDTFELAMEDYAKLKFEKVMLSKDGEPRLNDKGEQMFVIRVKLG